MIIVIKDGLACLSPKSFDVGRWMAIEVPGVRKASGCIVVGSASLLDVVTLCDDAGVDLEIWNFDS